MTDAPFRGADLAARVAALREERAALSAELAALRSESAKLRPFRIGLFLLGLIAPTALVLVLLVAWSAVALLFER